MDDRNIKHLEFVQNNIARMGNNSFGVKRMLITIVSALMAIYAETKNDTLLLIGIFPTILFWGLDAYYLQQERKFRGIYNILINDTSSEISLFEMPLNKFIEGEYGYWKVLFSKTILIMYLGIILLLIGIFMYMKFKNCIVICQ